MVAEVDCAKDGHHYVEWACEDCGHIENEAAYDAFHANRSDVCPGDGLCHGTKTWCRECGDVKEVCDVSGGCDVHKGRWEHAERKREERRVRELPKTRREEAEW